MKVITRWMGHDHGICSAGGERKDISLEIDETGMRGY